MRYPIVTRDKRPKSRGMRATVTHADGRTFVCWSQAELRAAIEGAPIINETAPGARAALCRAARRYL